MEGAFYSLLHLHRSNFLQNCVFKCIIMYSIWNNTSLTCHYLRSDGNAMCICRSKVEEDQPPISKPKCTQRNFLL